MMARGYLQTSTMCLVVICGARQAAAQTLEQQLQAESPPALASDAQQYGDATRGALIFHQPLMACGTCHQVNGAGGIKSGPDLTEWDRPPTDGDMVESVLFPSRVIRKGFESLQVITTDGRVLTGLPQTVSETEVILREPATGRLLEIPVQQIDEQIRSTTSVMPGGQVNQLGNRQQFLDLLKYLFEIRDGGSARAQQLQPPPSMFALKVPEYESRVDHAGLISDLNETSFERGAAVYNRLCINCHGDLKRPGSLPTALRFTQGRFRNGSDPYSMYRTLTHGFGFMVAQTWMVPQQKYDVIHYIREALLLPHNPSQYVDVTETWLKELPPGDTRGPKPARMDRWATMDYGPRLINTYEAGQDARNIAQKGIAVRLDAGPGGVARGSAWMVFDHDTLRMAAAWTVDPEAAGDRFIDWNGIHFNGRHGTHPRIVGQLQVSNSTGPGWADPDSGRLDDVDRILGRDNRRYGPLPRRWARYRGLWSSGDRTILDYTVGTTRVHEMPGMLNAAESNRSPVFSRTFHIAARDQPLTLVIGTLGDARLEVAADQQSATLLSHQGEQGLQSGLTPDIPNVRWTQQQDQLCLTLPSGDSELNFVVWFRATRGAAFAKTNPRVDTVADLKVLQETPQALWNTEITTNVKLGDDSGPFAIDHLTPPETNPWLAQTRLTGLDFPPGDDDRMAVCCWDGDVWMVRGLREVATTGQLHWKRIANGLFQPLGLKYVDDRLFVTCRDQIVVLEDHDGDGETDYYRCFNNDHQVTEHFHEFAMGLQADDGGNLYYAKSARHALTAVVPHHGTLLRVSADGERTDILANGFRAANGVCLNPDGSYVVTDQEGHWNPKNRINWVREGGFYGNMFGYHNIQDASDSAMEPPLCWITNAFDRSPGELLWVDSPSWGPLNGSLLNLSYGYGKAYVVPFEVVDGQPQGGMCEFPIPQFPTGTMRGRFRSQDGHLYTCGMFAWAGSRSHPGGLYRLRATGRASWLPRGLTTHPDGISIEWTDPLDLQAAADPRHYAIKVWSLKRTAKYGSDHYNEHTLEVTDAAVSADGRTVRLRVPDLGPTWCMEIRCELQTPAGTTEHRVIHNTIHTPGPQAATDTTPYSENVSLPKRIC